MGSPIGSMNNVKIFILYLMDNIGHPLDFYSLNDIVLQTDFVIYLDFAEAFHKMLDDGLIDPVGELNGDTLYAVTSKGHLVAETLHSDILSSILDKSLTAALRYLDFRRRGIEAHAEASRREDGRYELTCMLTEHGSIIYSTILVVDSLDRAVRMKDNFLDRPEVIYRGAHALLAGNMNFLFD